MICYIRALSLARSRAQIYLPFSRSFLLSFSYCIAVMMIVLSVVPVICLYRISVISSTRCVLVRLRHAENIYDIVCAAHAPVNGTDENVGLALTDRISLFRFYFAFVRFPIPGFTWYYLYENVRTNSER